MISLSKVLQCGIDSFFTVMKDQVITAQYRSYDDYTGDDYDTQTHQLEQPYKEFPIKGILTKFSKKDIFEAYGRIVIEDKKFIVKADSINRELFTGDLIIIENIEYSIIDLKKNPLGVTYVLQLREL